MIKDYSLESKFVKKLDQDILEFLERGMDATDDERFNELAILEFELQYYTIKPYRAYCEKKAYLPNRRKAGRKYRLFHRLHSRSLLWHLFRLIEQSMLILPVEQVIQLLRGRYSGMPARCD